VTAPTIPGPPPGPPPPTREPARSRSADLILARTHLRLGSLALARAELETIAGLGALDTAGLVDLAEVRWRTGDLAGAGEAAVAAIEVEGSDPVALVIAAEAAAADGRPTEARRLATLATDGVGDRIDRIFAGMPRSAVWPPDAAEPPPAAPTMFHREPEEATGRAPGIPEGGSGPEGEAAGAAGTSPVAGAGTQARGGAPAALTLGFWEGEGEVDPLSPELPDPAEAFHAGRAALVAGSVEEAALRFGLALRLAPALAPAVLEATEGARNPIIIVVRGDAYRLVGHEVEARQAYAVAAQGGLPDRRRRARSGAKSAGARASAPRPPVEEAAAVLLEVPEAVEEAALRETPEPETPGPAVDPVEGAADASAGDGDTAAASEEAGDAASSDPETAPAGAVEGTEPPEADGAPAPDGAPAG
jgi:hypothetical protein